MAISSSSSGVLRLALRGIARQPRVAFFVCLTLAVATAATTVIFTFVNALVGASYWPARQAMRIDPASAIRSE